MSFADAADVAFSINPGMKDIMKNGPSFYAYKQSISNLFPYEIL